MLSVSKMSCQYKESKILSAVESAAQRMGYVLRDKQLEVVVNFVRGRDTFVSLPTGRGKNLCYSVLPWTFDTLKKSHSSSIVIAVNPLIALMKDQVSSLTEKGLSAVYVSGEVSERLTEELHEDQFQVVFFSPETLLTDEIRGR